MQISIPDALKPWLDTQARQHGYASADEFVVDLLRREQGQTDTEDHDDQRTLAQLSVSCKADLESKILAGLASGPATPMTATDWQAIRRAVEERG